MARFFVRRPIVAMVISILIVLWGLVSLRTLPVSRYPAITPPEIQVQATYPGADALTVEKSVATPIEEQVNGVEHMIYMKSTNSSDGAMQLNVSFAVGTDLDTANMLVQNRVAQAQAQLPPAVTRAGVVTRKSLTFPLLIITLVSPKGTYDSEFLNNYAAIHLLDPIARVPGVGQVRLFGGSNYAMRIWVDPDRLAAHKLTVGDIAAAINAQNTIAPGGQIGGAPAAPGTDMTYTVSLPGRLETPQQFGRIVVRTDPQGGQVHLSDVARVEMGAESYTLKGRLGGEQASVIAVFQTPGSNALDVAGAVKDEMAVLGKQLPPDVAYRVPLDTTTAVKDGIREIVLTLALAVVLVVFVVFLFLHGWRATLIPLLTVPVSLIGTFILFPVLGFSVNTLSLLGLVLAIGIVVDDAIVVVEAVSRHIEEGMAPRDATVQAMSEVTGPIIAIALILVSVFVPVAFIGGITGRLYQQFAITIAVSVVLSAFNALSLSPALASRLLQPVDRRKEGFLSPFYRWFDRVFDRGRDRYLRVTRFLVRRLGLSALIIGAVVAGIVAVGLKLPTGFVPEEDQGYFVVNVQLPDAASLQRTDAVCRKIEKILAHLDGVRTYTSIVGFSILSGSSASNGATMFATLEPWSHRNVSVEQVVGRLNGILAMQVPGAQAFAFGPPAIPGLGHSAGFTMMLQDRGGHDPAYLADQVQRFVAAANARPELTRVFSSYSARVPQLDAHVDRDRALADGVSLSDLYETIGAGLGGAYVDDFNRFGRLYRVYVEAEPQFRNDPKDLGRFQVRGSHGQMVPLADLVRLAPSSGPNYTTRFDLYRSAQVTGSASPGYSSGQALDALKAVAQKVLPQGMGYEWSALSYQEQKAAGQGALVFLLSLVVVFLILAAQYESWSLPFSVLLGTPFAALGAFLAVFVARLIDPAFVNNVFAQIALVLLIGLAAKNAILVIEFARRRKEEEGLSALDAALEGARLRLRPILMTAFAFIFGVLPLVFATGAGAKAREVIGVAVFGGMAFASLMGIFFIPVLFVAVERIVDWGRAKLHRGGSGAERSS